MSKKSFKEGPVDARFLTLCQFVTVETEAEALFIVVDPKDDGDLQVGMTFAPGYDRLDTIIEALEKTAAKLKENRAEIQAAAAEVREHMECGCNNVKH